MKASRYPYRIPRSQCHQGGLKFVRRIHNNRRKYRHLRHEGKRPRYVVFLGTVVLPSGIFDELMAYFLECCWADWLVEGVVSAVEMER
jgi:hypothetical protein